MSALKLGTLVCSAMSTDGPGLFSDDTAFDVREEYRDALTAGLSDDAAMAQVLAEFADDLDGVDTSPVMWLALAYPVDAGPPRRPGPREGARGHRFRSRSAPLA